MSRCLFDISRELILTQHEADMFQTDDLRERIDDLTEEMTVKEDGIYFFYKDFDKEIELCKEQTEKIKKYSKWLKTEQERLKQYVVSNYQITSSLPKHSAFNPIRVSTSPGAVEVLEETLIPDEYWVLVTTRKLDKKRILSELKEGIEIPGVKLTKNDYVKGLK